MKKEIGIMQPALNVQAPAAPASFSRLHKGLLTLALLFLAASAAMQFMLANAGAKNWLLYAAGRIFEGRKIYLDIFEINPPLILWIDAIPAWMSQNVSFLKDYEWLAILAFLVIAVSIALCGLLMRRHPAFIAEPLKGRLFLLLLAFAFVFLTPPVYFFDREEIMLVTIFPYILRWMPSLARSHFPLKLRLLVGGLAAVGFCMKPHALIIFSMLQALFMLRERSLRMLRSPENILIYLGGALYMSCILLFARDYLTIVFPMAMKTYMAYRLPKVDSLTFFIPVCALLGIAFSDFRRHATPYRRDVFYCLGTCLIFALYAFANNGWGYTFDPLISMAFITCGWVWMEYHYLKKEKDRLRESSRQFAFGMRACALVFGLGTAFFLTCFFFYFSVFDCSKDKHCHAGDSFMKQAMKYPRRSFISTPLDPEEWVRLAHITNTRWDTRFAALFMLPRIMMLGDSPQADKQWIANYVSHAYAEDIMRWKPDTAFINTSPDLFYKLPNIDLIAFFSKAPEFREAWKPYHYVGVVDVCHAAAAGEPATAAVTTDCRYAVYQRDDN